MCEIFIPNVISDITLKYFRVLVVRHPFVRLISAWNDKLLTSNIQSWPMFRTFRMSRFSPAATPTHRISFSDFVDYLITAISHNEIINRHFQPQSGMCDPCASNYNHVLKVSFFQKTFGKHSHCRKFFPNIHRHWQKICRHLN